MTATTANGRRGRSRRWGYWVLVQVILLLQRAGAVPKPSLPAASGSPRRVPERERPRVPVAAVEEVAQRLQNLRFEPDDSRAPWVLAYGATTQRVAAELRKGAFDDDAWIADLATVFAGLYFEALSQFGSRASTPLAWRIAFEAGAAGRTLGGQDVLLAMNAHIQRDLPYALARVGVARERRSDFHRVLRVFEAVFGHVRDGLESYDPFLEVELPYVEPGVVKLIEVWRDIAWEGATKLVCTEGEDHRRVMEAIEQYSEAWARRIVTINFSWLRPLRLWWSQRSRAVNAR